MLVSVLEMEKAGGVTGWVVEVSSVLNTLHLRCYVCACVRGILSGLVALGSSCWGVERGKLLLISSFLSLFELDLQIWPGQ